MDNISPFKNDPFVIVYNIFRKLYPDARVDEIFWETDLAEREGEQCFGTIHYREDGSNVIYIDAGLNIYNAIEIFAHELAHAVAGENGGHNEVWQTAFDRIYEEYMKYVQDKNEEQNDDNSR